MKEEKIRKILTYAGAAFLFIFCIAPFVWMIIISLNEHPDFLSR